MTATTKKIKRYDELTFTDDFMFCKVLQNNPDLCKELTEMITGIEIGEIISLNKQHPIEITSDGRGVRFDVYLKDDRGTVADIEMQTTFSTHLPKRTRYYQGMIDLENMERSGEYIELPKSYIIFICLDNPFPAYGRHKYTFSSMCEEDTSLKLNDEAVRIFLSADGDQDDVSEDMKKFLRYLVDQRPESGLTQKIDEAVNSAKAHQKWSAEYMTLYEMRKLDREEGREEGGLDMLYDLVCSGDLPLEKAVQKAAKYGISNEAEFRNTAVRLGYDLSEIK